VIFVLSIVAAAAIAYEDVPVIVGKRTVGETCVVSARDQEGPFNVVVSWATCREVSVRLTSIAELAETDELRGLECQDVAAIAQSNRGHLISAWGEFTATVYAREARGTREIAVSD
jgi:hypothetical protein